MRSRAWAIYLSIGGALLTAFVFVHPIRVGPLFNVIGLSASVAILIGARMNEPRQRLPWYLVATGQALFVAGDVITYNYERFFGTAPPFPSIGDLLLPQRLSVPDRRGAAAGPTEEPGPRPRQPDRLPDHRRRRRHAVVGVPAGPVRARPVSDARGEADRHGVSHHGPDPVRGGRAARGRPREAPPGLLPDGWVRRRAVHDRHDLHTDPPARLVRQHHRPPRARVGTLLPVVGRGRAPPVDGGPGRADPRERPATPAQTAGGARGRLVDRPDRHRDPGDARRAGRRPRAGGVLGVAVRPGAGAAERAHGRRRRVPTNRATDARGGGQVPIARRGPARGRLHRRVREGRGVDVHQPEGRIDPRVHAGRVDGPGRPVA